MISLQMTMKLNISPPMIAMIMPKESDNLPNLASYPQATNLPEHLVVELKKNKMNSKKISKI